MTFLNPILLYAGLGCIAVPIIVHLLTRRRRKPIAWGAMRFLLEAYRKHRRRLTLEQLILLACRCALVALIALALGKPVVSGMAASAPGPRTLYLLIDNGVTSTLTDEQGHTALDRHKAAAAALLARLDPLRADRAALVSLGSPAEALVVPPSADLAAIGRLVAGLEPTDSRADVSGALSRVAADLGGAEPGGNVTLALLSEWRAGSADTDRPLPALAGSVRPGEAIPLVLAAPPATDPVDNISVVSCTPLRPVLLARQEASGPGAPLDSTPVRVLLARRGPGVGAAAATKLRVRVDPVAPSAPPGSVAEATVRWTPGQEQASITLPVPLAATPAGPPIVIAEIDRDALAADNIRRRPIESRPSLAIGLGATPGSTRPSSIDRFSPADWLRLAVAPEGESSGASRLRIVDVEPRSIGAAGTLAALDALLIPAPDRLDGPAWSRVGEFARSGGLVLVFAPADEGVQLWADGFLRETGLPWTIGREPRSYAPPADLADATGNSELLGLLTGELGELAKPVRVARAVPVEVPVGSGDVLLRLRDGSPLVLAAPPRSPAGALPRGLVVLCATACDLRWTDLPTKPLMVPLLQEIVRQGVGAARGVWSAEAGAAPPTPPGTVELHAQGSSDVVRLGADAPGPLRRAGVWTARDARGSSLGLVAVNADLGGCDTTPRATAALTPWLAAIAGPQRLQWSAELAGAPAPGGQPASTSLGSDGRPPVSAPLLAAAACVALVELLLARLFSHATLPGVPRGASQGSAP